MGIKITNTLRNLLLVLYITRALSQECIVTKDVMDTAVDITNESSDIVISMYDYVEYEDCIQECCDEENCTLVMYMEESMECILIDCSVGECITVTTEGSTLIYVSHTNDPTTTLITPYLTTLDTTASTGSSHLPTDSSDYQTNSTKDFTENGKVPSNHTDISANNSKDLTNSSEILATHGDTSTNDIGISTDSNINSTNDIFNSTDTLKAGLTSFQSTEISSTDGIGNLTNKTTPTSVVTLAQNTETAPTSFGDYSINTFESVSKSTSKQTTYTGQMSPSSSPSLPALLSTLLSETSTKAALGTSANTAAMKNSTHLGSFSTSSSFILSTLATNLPRNENVTSLQNHSLSVTSNDTNDNETTGSAEIEILNENATIASITPNVSSVPANNTDYNNETMTSTTVLISESTSSVTPGSTFKQSTVSEVPSSHSSSSWWLFNMSSVSSTLPLLKTSLSSLVPTVSSLQTTTSTEHSSSGNSRASTSSSALSSLLSTSVYSRTSAWSESTVSSSESSFTSSDTNKTAHAKISSSGSDSDQMSGTLIAVLCVGIVFTFAVGLLFGQRVYDAWQRRHYNKLDYLINGMYG